MRAMQERAYAKRSEQYLLLNSPPAFGQSLAPPCFATLISGER
jgi:hypothetical protein